MEDIVAMETQKSYLEEFTIFSTQAFIKETDAAYSKIIAIGDDYNRWREKEDIRKQYLAKYFPRGGMVYKTTRDWWHVSYDDYARGDYIVTAPQGFGAVPVEKDNEKWFYGPVAEIPNCLIHYKVDPEKGLNQLHYRFSREGESEYDPYGGIHQSDGEKYLERATDTMLKLLTNKYGSPLFKFSILEQQLNYQNKLPQEIKPLYDYYRNAMIHSEYGRNLFIPHYQAMWHVECARGNVLICLHSGEYQCKYKSSINTCDRKKNDIMGIHTQENICDVTYFYFSREEFNEEIRQRSRRIENAAIAARKKEEERIEKINSEI